MALRKIALDDGHGINTAGKRTPYIASIGRAIRENEFNEPVVMYLKEELERNGYEVLLTAPTDSDTPLSTRVNTANNAKVDAFISIHFNAYDGSFGGADPSGFSAHVHSDKYESAKIGRACLKRLAQGTKQNNRGLVVQNLYVTRESKMPAVLFELGFMDNSQEAELMLNEGFQRECAIEIAKGICDYDGKTYKSKAEVKTSSTGDDNMDEKPVSSWAESAWKEAQENEFLDGTRPHDPITRQEFAVVLQRLMNKLNK